MAAIISLLATLGAIFLDDLMIHPQQWMAGVDTVISSGVIPTLIILSAVAAVFFFVRFYLGGSTAESVQSVFTMVTVAWVVMTVTCVWLRGIEMKLVWP